MGSVRTILSVALIPALLTAQANLSQLAPSVRVALRKPPKDRILLTRKDGTIAEGLIVRATTEFLTFDGAGGCKNVELGDVSKISPVPSEPSTAGQIIGTVFLHAFLPMIALAAWDSQPEPKPENPIAGTWESVYPRPDGRVYRVDIRGESARQTLVSVRKGRYQFREPDLTVSFEDAAGAGLVEEHRSARFDCNLLLLDGQRLGLANQPKRKNRAEPPILGRWESRQATRWLFRADGTFQTEAFGQNDLESGTIQRQKKGFHVELNRFGVRARTEEWQTRMKSGHLFINRNGDPMEYRKIDYF
jgi:hypothetical protein